MSSGLKNLFTLSQQGLSLCRHWRWCGQAQATKTGVNDKLPAFVVSQRYLRVSSRLVGPPRGLQANLACLAAFPAARKQVNLLAARLVATSWNTLSKIYI